MAEAAGRKGGCSPGCSIVEAYRGSQRITEAGMMSNACRTVVRLGRGASLGSMQFFHKPALILSSLSKSSEGVL